MLHCMAPTERLKMKATIVYLLALVILMAVIVYYLWKSGQTDPATKQVIHYAAVHEDSVTNTFSVYTISMWTNSDMTRPPTALLTTWKKDKLVFIA